MNNRQAKNHQSHFSATSIHPLIQEVPNVTYVTVTREPSPPPLPPKLRQQPKERLLPKQRVPPIEPRERPQTVYINSSNGYIDKEVSNLKIRVNKLEQELEAIKKLLEKQNKQNY